MDKKLWNKILRENKLNEKSDISKVKSLANTFFKNAEKQAASMEKQLRGKQVEYKNTMYRIMYVDYNRRDGLYVTIINLNDATDGIRIKMEKLYSY